MDGTFQSCLADHDIVHQTSCIDTLNQNGVAEQKNRYLLEVARSFISIINVLKSYWGDAILTIIYLINRMSLRVLNFNLM